MALLFMDGFDHVDDDYKTLKWDTMYSLLGSYIALGSGYGVSGGWGIRMQNPSSYIKKILKENTSELIVGYSLKLSTLSDSAEILTLKESTNNNIELRATTLGGIAVYNGTTLLGTSSNAVITTNEWFYLEVKAVFSNTVGSVEIRVNGGSVVNITGVDTCLGSSEYVNIVYIHCNYDSYMYIDNLYICDTTGTENNDFLGDVTITTLYPTSDGNSSDLTPSTGVDNYATVDEPQLADVTDYNSSSTIGHKDTFGMTALTGGAPILAVQTVAAVNNTTTGTINVRNISRSGDTPADNEGSDLALSQTVKAAIDIFEKEPTDDVAWTVAKVNAAEFGIKIES